jgi:hypothetical protein
VALTAREFAANQPRAAASRHSARRRRRAGNRARHHELADAFTERLNRLRRGQRQLDQTDHHPRRGHRAMRSAVVEHQTSPAARRHRGGELRVGGAGAWRARRALPAQASLSGTSTPAVTQANTTIVDSASLPRRIDLDRILPTPPGASALTAAGVSAARHRLRQRGVTTRRSGSDSGKKPRPFPCNAGIFAGNANLAFMGRRRARRTSRSERDLRCTAVNSFAGRR